MILSWMASWRVAATCFAFCHFCHLGPIESWQASQELPAMLHCLAHASSLGLLSQRLPACNLLCQPSAEAPTSALNKKDVIPWRCRPQRRCRDGPAQPHCRIPLLGPGVWNSCVVSSPAGMVEYPPVTILSQCLSLSLPFCLFISFPSSVGQIPPFALIGCRFHGKTQDGWLVVLSLALCSSGTSPL